MSSSQFSSGKMFKHVILFLSLIIFAISGEKSFTIVLDTTISMRDEINVIKANIGQVINSINRTDIGNYILVPFKDTVVETHFATASPRHFTSHLSNVTTSGGFDCPENSLAGIESALRASSPESYIFVFTDAYAKDYNRLRSVEALCRESHSQVIIFLSGFCWGQKTSTVDNAEVYYEVAKACSGTFFRFNTTFELRQAFVFMKEVVKTEWTDVMPQDKFLNSKELTFSVDSFTTDFLISISGNRPQTILNSYHQLTRANRVFETRNALVVRLNKPESGPYTLSIRGQGAIYVTFYEKNYVPFQYGFSTMSPRSLMETSARPIAGRKNYVLINVDTEIKLNSIEWLDAGDNAKKNLYLEEKRPGLYITSTSVEPGKSFRIWIIGEDVVTHQPIRGSTKYIYPQVPVTNASRHVPVAEIQDTDLGLLDYGADVTLACKVTAFPKPTIRWEDDSDSYFPAEDVLLEIPSVFISYVTLTNVTKNSTVYCKCENQNGATYRSIALFVNRTFRFEVKESPEDTTVEYGNDLTLKCQVEAFPEATVSWYLNDTKIYPFNTKVEIHENSLVVKNVSLEDGGVYECVASNDVETKELSATVTISGLEAPEIAGTRHSDLNVKPGEWIDINCGLTKGKPAPEITWKYKLAEGNDFDALPAGATVNDGELRITSADKQHGGLYRCTASNVVGKDSKEVFLKIQIPPTIKNEESETITVAEGDTVNIPCDVESVPEATVQWEMSQDDVIITLNDKYRIDDRNTLHFIALWNDSGNYHCFAENNVGKAERTVTVNVLVSPYIETPKSKTVYAGIGDSVNLSCIVSYGNPAPNVVWKFIAVDSTSNILTRGNSTLHLENVSQSDEGSYLCIAENQIGTDSIKYSLKVH